MNLNDRVGRKTSLVHSSADRQSGLAASRAMSDTAPRHTGISSIGAVPWGTHFCQFYQTKQDLLDLLVPYFTEGLVHHEFCMWVTSEPLSAPEAEAALRKAVPDLDQALAQDQLEIIPYTDWYRIDGIFDADRVLNAWVEKLKGAQARGFEGLRLTGNTFWLESKEWAAFTAYEEQVDRVIGRYPMLALCTYSLGRCGAAEVIDVVANHQFALIKREGRWTRIESTEHTARKAMAAQASRLERLAALGQLLGGIAHEIRNPLFILTGHLQLLRDKLRHPPAGDLAPHFQKLDEAAKRLAAITDRFLQLARGTPTSQGWCSVPAAIQATLNFLSNELMRNQIRVVTAIPPALPEVWAAREQLQEIFLNLMLNAMQAMSAAHGQGTLTVMAKLVRGAKSPLPHPSPSGGEGKTGAGAALAPSPLEGEGRGEGGAWIEARIQDDGPGIPPEHQAKIFEPFFSTKPPGQGTGLGLWIVRSNLMVIGGSVRVESEVGKGATFIVRLPVMEESRQQSALSLQPQESR